MHLIYSEQVRVARALHAFNNDYQYTCQVSDAALDSAGIGCLNENSNKWHG